MTVTNEFSALCLASSLAVAITMTSQTYAPVRSPHVEERFSATELYYYPQHTPNASAVSDEPFFQLNSPARSRLRKRQRRTSCLKSFKLPLTKRVIRHLLLTAITTVIALALSFGLAFKYVVHDVDYYIPLQESSDTQQNFTLVTNFLAVDILAGTLTADWYPLPNCSRFPEEIINVFFDPNLLVPINPGASDEVPSDETPETPTFQFNTTTRCTSDLKHGSPTFRTVSKVIQRNLFQTGPSGLNGASIQSYPFDRYFVQLSLFAQINATNDPISIITGKPFGNAVNFNIELNSGLSTNSPNGLLISLDITRSTAVQLLAILMVIGNWCVTVAFIYVTVASFLWNEEEVIKEVFVVPLAALFGFTSVRANLPGAPPGFGLFIDFIGILPNLAILILCSAILLILVLWRRIIRHSAVDSYD